MKYLYLTVLALLLSFSPLAYAEEFVEGMEDVPLLNGMQQISQDDISFGNEETRLIEAYFNTQKLKFKQIADFYSESLPQLGWIYQGNRGDSLLFYREGETLEVVKESASPLIVRITVKTKP